VGYKPYTISGPPISDLLLHFVVIPYSVKVKKGLA